MAMIINRESRESSPTEANRGEGWVAARVKKHKRKGLKNELIRKLEYLFIIFIENDTKL